MKVKFAFFGSSEFSVHVLDELERAGFIPACVVTTPDKPVGRKLALTPTPVKAWALTKHIEILEPAKLDVALAETLKKQNCDVFIVASYSKIIPGAIINIPVHKTLNIHPSLLPLYRGASPIQSACLDDARDTGVTIMRIDEQMDHGPIVVQEKVHIDEWSVYEELEETLARTGGQLLVSIMPDWIAGKIVEKPQEHSRATYTRKIVKEDGLLDAADLAPGGPKGRAFAAFRKIQAYHAWPVAYFFIEHKGKRIRVKITRAYFKNDALAIERVIPEGGSEMGYADFSRGYSRD